MTSKYVVVVDDEPDQVETISLMLESKGVEVGKAYDGVEGGDLIRAKPPDLIILDVMMPRKDGYTLCSELKRDPKTAEVPIILLTAVGDEVSDTDYSHADGMSTEANDYIPKPVDTASLWETVSMWLE